MNFALTLSSHWSAEVLFGIWRAYSSLDLLTGPDGRTTLPFPKRLTFRHVKGRDWTDRANLNQWVNRGAFPGIGIQVAEDWEDQAEMQTVFVYERVVLADRAAADEGESFQYTWRSASSAFALPGNENWWLPLRRSVLEYSGVPERWIVGPDPGSEQERYVITYISRQDWTRRKIIPANHDVSLPLSCHSRKLTRVDDRLSWQNLTSCVINLGTKLTWSAWSRSLAQSRSQSLPVRRLIFNRTTNSNYEG